MHIFFLCIHLNKFLFLFCAVSFWFHFFIVGSLFLLELAFCIIVRRWQQQQKRQLKQTEKNRNKMSSSIIRCSKWNTQPTIRFVSSFLGSVYVFVRFLFSFLFAFVHVYLASIWPFASAFLFQFSFLVTSTRFKRLLPLLLAWAAFCALRTAYIQIHAYKGRGNCAM